MALQGNFAGVAKRLTDGKYSVKSVVNDKTQGAYKLVGQFDPLTNVFVGTAEKLKPVCPTGCVSATPDNGSGQPVSITGVVSKRNRMWGVFFNSQVVHGYFTEGVPQVQMANFLNAGDTDKTDWVKVGALAVASFFLVSYAYNKLKK